MPESKEKNTAEAKLLDVLDRAVPQHLQARLKQLEEEHEDNFVLIADMVAVLDISTNATSLIDGVPPYYDVVTGSDIDLEVRGDKAGVEFTKQGLRKTLRYEIVLNHIPQTDYVYKFTVVPRKQWEEYAKNRAKGIITPEQELAGLMLRSGGAI